MQYGYARISTKDQCFNLQIDALKKSGCETIFREIAKGARQDRPELNKLLEIIKEGDLITIWKLDHFWGDCFIILLKL